MLHCRAVYEDTITDRYVWHVLVTNWAPLPPVWVSWGRKPEDPAVQLHHWERESVWEREIRAKSPAAGRQKVPLSCRVERKPVKEHKLFPVLSSCQWPLTVGDLMDNLRGVWTVKAQVCYICSNVFALCTECVCSCALSLMRKKRLLIEFPPNFSSTSPCKARRLPACLPAAQRHISGVVDNGGWHFCPTIPWGSMWYMASSMKVKLS